MNNRIRLINHRANRLKRPERIREAISLKTGERFKVFFWRIASDYKMLLNGETHDAIAEPLMIIDNPEEGD